MKMITTGDIKISVLVDRADGVRALRAVHQAFRPAASRGPGPAGRRRGTAARRSDVPADRRRTSGRDLAAADAAARQHGGHRRQRRAADTDQGRITIFDLPDRAGNCSRVFQAVAAGGIVVDMIVQNLTDAGRAELSFSVPQSDLERAAELDPRSG